MTNNNFPFIADEFSGKRALVTGGTKGMGEAIVKRLTRGEARVVTTARSIPSQIPSALPPINSPQHAIRAYIVLAARKNLT